MSDITDVRIDAFTDSSPVAKVRITHLPTGASVEGSGIGMHRLKTRLLSELGAKIKGSTKQETDGVCTLKNKNVTATDRCDSHEFIGRGITMTACCNCTKFCDAEARKKQSKG